MKLRYLNYVLVSLAFIALIFSLIYSQRIDEPGLKLPFNFIHPIYWAGIAIFTVSIVLSTKLKFTTTSSLLILALAIAYNDLFYSAFLYTRPMIREIYHASPGSYIFKYGNVNPPLYPGPIETVVPGIFTSIFSQVTHVEITQAISYLPCVFFMLYVFFAYVVLRRLSSNNTFVTLGVLLVLSSNIMPFGQYRSGFAMPFYMLMLLAALRIFGGRKHLGDALSLLILGASITLTHPSISFFSIIVFASSSALILLVSRFYTLKRISGSLGYLRLGITLMVIYLCWYTFRRIIPFVGGILSAINSLLELVIAPDPFVHYSARLLRYTPEYQNIVNLRTVEVALITLMAWLLLFFTTIKNRSSMFKRYESLTKISILVAGLAVFSLSLIPTVFTGIWIGNMLLTLPPWAAMSIVFLANFNHSKLKERGRKICLGFIVVLVISFFIASPLAKWNSLSTLIQIPTREVHALEFMAEYLPVAHTTVIGGVGIGHGGTARRACMSDSIRFIYADRIDLYIDSIATPTITHLDPEEALFFVQQYEIIAFSRYALTLNSKYATEIPIEDMINYILNSLSSDTHYNFVYSSDWPYSVFVKT